MCGIAGWVGPAREHSYLAGMLDAIAHRGPDGSGTAFLASGRADHEVALGHRRLSILDLEGGAQPMQSADGRHTLTFNGEIYNFVELKEELAAFGVRFKTASDTEVILAAWARWGKDALLRFRGMFALAIYDRADGSVSFARDPFGKKPLYFAQSGETHLFASEITALLAHPDINAKLNVAAVYDFLTWRYVPSPQTFFEGITKLAPGTVAVLKNGKITHSRYWTPPELDPPAEFKGDPVEAFQDIFDTAVAMRLRSDVPVGMFLSSGIDSAAVLESIVRSGASVKAFSVGFSAAQLSELNEAEAIARHFQTDFEPVILTADGLSCQILEMTKVRAGPVSEPADVAVFAMSHRASRDVKVVLTGEGADEHFTGYPKHLIEARLGRSDLLSRTAGLALSAVKDRRLKIAGKALRSKGREQRLVQWFGALSEAERETVWKTTAPCAEFDRMPFLGKEDMSPLRRILHFDQTSWLPDNVLERGDRMTMAASIELRAPFMDVDLSRLAASLPDYWRASGRTTKRVLREAMAERLPKDVLSRRKLGFPVPVGDWFRAELSEMLRTLLVSRDTVITEFVDADWIAGILRAHENGDAAQDKLLWMLFSLELFLRTYFGRKL